KRVIVFTRTKHHANRVAETLGKAGHRADAIHGNKSQNARQRALEGFRSGRSRVLVATDIAARGIDIDDVSHVINLDIPDVAENYIHRIGRTARAGSGGIAISFCDASERSSLRAIEQLVKRPLTVAGDARRPPVRQTESGNEARPPRKWFPRPQVHGDCLPFRLDEWVGSRINYKDCTAKRSENISGYRSNKAAEIQNLNARKSVYR
ncbi:MAG TPA: C-terminal helicase domain-containing protein, partial [Micropepsaceae bacterium]|nr:C-terminal helicase domain-containing protein [Micropepsaceae bacterium]